ncbi:uncharacterized protein LOC101745293 [Bombyx mori]|uniref:Uncharacterized protein n=1 Tax=Bombyx mori TaxID=7091 RepID=A0A8R1WLH3_BOMMO|nr:uncharacterized protein LOC101745293 [Bombyx mori]
MSKKISEPIILHEIRVDGKKKRHSEYALPPKGASQGPRKVSGSEFVYVNSAYVGSTQSVNQRLPEPPTSVIREQYWTCSRWPQTQRVILAAAGGVLLGAIIGLIVTMTLRDKEDNVIGGIFRHSTPD